MKNIRFFFITNLFIGLSLQLLTTTIIAQQPCSEDVLMNTKGTWKRASDANMKAGNQSQAISRIDKMQKILLAAYPEPKGIEAKWYRTMVNDPLIINGPIPYQFNALFLTYYCNTYNHNKELGDETETWFYVYANHFNWFMEYDQFFSVHKQPVYLLTKKVGEIHGYPLYEGIHNGTSNTGTKYSRTVIITRPGNSPYVPVTRKQYLQLFIKLKEKNRTEQIQFTEKKPERTAAEQEIVKQKGMENALRGASPNRIEERRASYLKRYRTDKEQKEEDLLNLNKRYDDYIKAAKDLLNNMNEVDAKMPAIVSNDYISKFERFFSEEEGGRMLVRLNPDYFNNKLPNYVPQFLIVYWRWEKNKPSQNFKEQIETHFNFNALQQMLDK